MDLSKLLGKYGAASTKPADPRDEQAEVIMGVPASAKVLVCDSCGDPLTAAVKDIKKLGKLSLCEKCFTIETEAKAQLEAEGATNIPEYKKWPQCVKCGAHVKAEHMNEGQLCKNCFVRPRSVELVGFKTTDSNKYQDFFNAETEAIVAIVAKYATEQEALNEIRDRIIQWQQDIFSTEAELLRKRTAKQSAQIKFNAILQKMSLDEQKKYKIEDSTYVSSGGAATKKLASPLGKIAKKAKVKKDLDQSIADLFGDSMTPEEIAIAKKKLGL